MFPPSIGVVLYTLFGGIKATFITDYMHTFVILVVVFLFAFSAHATNAELGSPGKVYDALVAAAKMHPVDGNAEESYLTMRSKEGGIFWAINAFGPPNYDYESMRAIRKVDDTDVAAAAHIDLELLPGETDPSQTQSDGETRKLNRAALYARTLTIFLALALLILWPIPIYGTSYVFSRRFFTGWVVVAFLYAFWCRCFPAVGGAGEYCSHYEVDGA